MIPLNENFTNPQGEFPYYDSSNIVIYEQIAGNKHVDIRGLVPSGLSAGGLSTTMLHFDSEDMAEIDGQFMSNLDTASGKGGDNWSIGTVGPIANMGGYVGLALVCASGTTITTSSGVAVNLKGFSSEDYISLTLGNFPQSHIAPSGSYVELANETESQKLFLSESTTPIGTGNTQATWSYINLKVFEPTSVSLAFVTNSGATIDVMGLRLLAKTWKPFPYDMNTQGQFYRAILTPSGTIPSSPTPVYIRANSPPSILTDPHPINSTMGVNFYTGVAISGGELGLRFREIELGHINQLDLDVQTQSQIEASGHQPDFGLAIYQPRTQELLNQENQEELNMENQGELERFFNPSNSFELYSKLLYSPSLTTLTLGANPMTGSPYTFTTTSGLQPYQYYYWLTTLKENTMSASLYEVSGLGTISTTPIFSTGQVLDPANFPRVAGRIGWKGELFDKNAFVKNVNSVSQLFAEYQSKQFQSRTPVQGASLTVSATPPQELYRGALSLNGAALAINNNISNSAQGSLQITAKIAQGLITYPFTPTNINTVKIKFDVYIPSSTFNIEVPHFFIFNERELPIEVFLGEIVPNQWLTYEIPSTILLNQASSGYFRFATITLAQKPVTWYMDNISILQDTISWSARSAPADPWESNPVAWINFGNTLNDPNSGITFNPTGKALQVRARAHSPSAIISRIWLKPKYQELGNFTFK